ncbi:hypothetical protein POM88_020192 [Heracleum sosnowskyi]|uniref:Uncharacterized protein n=1 Tax=Heracleum sosnowskyi TaxID=360622 RepID=A0AAD8MRM8_9APIA|nr:hypothetical protein POM88_020192 [Heracleum sosnowskyi]
MVTLLKIRVPSSVGPLCRLVVDLRQWIRPSFIVLILWNKVTEPRLFVQLGCGSILGALGATCVYPLQTRIRVQHSDATYAPFSEVPLFRRSLQHHHEGLKGFYMTALSDSQLMNHIE